MPEEIRFTLHETMFRQSSIDGLCQWLGVPAFEARVSAKINASPTVEQLSEQTARAVALHCPSVYAVAREIFGSQAIETYWTGFRWVPAGTAGS